MELPKIAVSTLPIWLYTLAGGDRSNRYLLEFYIHDISVFNCFEKLFFASLMRRHGTNEANKKLVRLELDLVAKGLSKGEINLYHPCSYA